MPRVRSSPSEIHWTLSRGADVVALQSVARSFAQRHGFESAGRWAVAIAVSELATNALKYGDGGAITLRWLESDDALEIACRDEGPGFRDPVRALSDHVSEGVDLRETPMRPDARRGLGTGLGAVARLMDTLAIENAPGGGGLVRARRHRRVGR